MTSPVTPSVPAGWYPDPAGGARSRWWDGTQWTEHFQEPYDPAAAAAALKAPEGTQWNTPWIWLIIVIPLLPMIGLLTIDWRSMFTFDPSDPTSAMNAQFAIFTSPGYLLAVLGGWVGYALCALFAFLDWRELQKRGVPKPFHFAWVFLSSLVYVIGRSVVVRRRTGDGIVPMYAAIASIVLIFIFTIIMMIQMFNAIYSQMDSYLN